MILTSPCRILCHISPVITGSQSNPPNLVHIFGSVPVASRIKIGVCGLCFFMVGYARLRNDLLSKDHVGGYLRGGKDGGWWMVRWLYLVTSLACDEWQRWNRTSLRPEVKTYLVDIFTVCGLLFWWLFTIAHDNNCGGTLGSSRLGTVLSLFY